MNKHIKRILAGGVVVTTVAIPFTIAHKQKELNEKIIVEYEAIIEQHQAEVDSLLKSAEEVQAELDSKNKQIQELEAENQALEGVRSIIIDNVGYYPSTYERQLLERLVECEAGAESMTGKIAVVNVVLNRIKSDDFPDSITDVIYQKNQFEPVVVGIINNKQASQESVEAVKRAFLGERAVDSDIVNFWASWLDSNNDIWNHVEIVTTIGVHHFGRGWN